MDPDQMAKLQRNKGVVLWLTGLSGAGKSTLGEALAPVLVQRGREVEVLDGDIVRTHLSQGLGYSQADRETNVMRIAFVARLLARHGVVVIVAAISPFRDVRDRARDLIGDFVEVYVSTPLEECMKRDVKGLYAAALSGKVSDFTGVSQLYEPPELPELKIDTSHTSLGECIASIEEKLEALGYLEPHLLEGEPHTAVRSRAARSASEHSEAFVANQIPSGGCAKRHG